MATLKVPHNLFHSPGLRPELPVNQGVRGPGQLLPAAVRAPQLQVVEAGPVPVGHLPADAPATAQMASGPPSVLLWWCPIPRNLAGVAAWVWPPWANSMDTAAAH